MSLSYSCTEQEANRIISVGILVTSFRRKKHCGGDNFSASEGSLPYSLFSWQQKCSTCTEQEVNPTENICKRRLSSLTRSVTYSLPAIQKTGSWLRHRKQIYDSTWLVGWILTCRCLQNFHGNAMLVLRCISCFTVFYEFRWKLVLGRRPILKSC